MFYDHYAFTKVSRIFLKKLSLKSIFSTFSQVDAKAGSGKINSLQNLYFLHSVELMLGQVGTKVKVATKL